MGRAVYFDCFSGAAGDMLLGALLDVGVNLDELRAGLRSLAVGGWRLDVESTASRVGVPADASTSVRPSAETPPVVPS